MSSNKNINLISVILMLAVILTVTVFAIQPRSFNQDTASTGVRYENYFKKNSVMKVNILVNKEKWQSMLDDAREEKYIKCDVVINGKRINNVGIRPKGNSSLEQVASSNSDRYSFKLEFDHYVTDQTFDGLDKLVLNNTQADATYMKEYMAYNIFNFIGVATPLYTYANIKVNGENWGCYLALESMEEAYATRVFGLEYGKLYRPESMNMLGGMNRASADSGGSDLVYTDDEISSYSAIFNSAVFDDTTEEDEKNVINALKNLSTGTNLERYINVKSTLRYFAAQTFIINFDSYYGKLQHNYYLYEKDGQLTMLPWDLNLAFGGFQSKDASSDINNPIDTPLSGASMEDRPMLSKLLAVPEYKELYHKYLDEIVKGYFDSGLFTKTIKDTDALIKPYVKEDATAFYSYDEYTAAVPVLESFGMLRARSVAGQLGGSIPSTEEGQSENPAALVDTGNLDISKLGSQGENGVGGKGSLGANMGGNNGWMQNNTEDDLLEKVDGTIPAINAGEEVPRMQRPNRNSKAVAVNTNISENMNADVNRISKADLIAFFSICSLLTIGMIFIICFKRRKYRS